MSNKEIYFIVGPTASGKSAFAVELAKKISQGNPSKPPLTPPKLGGGESKIAEIISADSRQICKGLNVSTGKITSNEMQGIIHYGLDLINPGENFSVFEFEKYCLEKIKEITQRGNIPIIVGGTGFYIDTILYEQNLPEVKENKLLREELKNKNNGELFEILRELQLEHSEILKKFSQSEFKNNKQRIIRTIEIIKELGYYPKLEKKLRYNNFQIIYIRPEKEKLKINIEKRFENRMKDGMIEEIKNVIEKYNLNESDLKKLGFEFHLTYLYLNNFINLEKYKELFLLQELQYTKRQKTWFNRYLKLKECILISK